MIIFIAGATHTGKTVLAQKILEKYKYPYLSIDHIKMGLIKSGYTSLTPEDDGELTRYLWPVVREIAKTAIENRQNLVIEGAYIPPDWKKDFGDEYLKDIRYYCLIMSERYIRNHFEDIKSHANDIEQRLDDSHLSAEVLIAENAENLKNCRKYGCDYILIDIKYNVDINL
ncbi:MAG: zeta toxin family protein [Acutalibacteraceae bacterium]|nr:zeta toxin family protein [Acutalibacteraceae bacterium]